MCKKSKMNKKISKELLTSTLLVTLLFSVGTYLGLFEQLSWYDEIVHFIAGAWGGIIIIWIYKKYKNKIPFYKKFKSAPITTVVVLMIIVGIGWELFELSFVEYVKAAYDYRLGLQPNHLDTVTDLILDGLGGWCAAYKTKD